MAMPTHEEIVEKKLISAIWDNEDYSEILTDTNLNKDRINNIIVSTNAAIEAGINVDDFIKDCKSGYAKACEKLSKASINNQIIYLGQRADAIKIYEKTHRHLDNGTDPEQDFPDYKVSKNPHICVLGKYFQEQGIV